MKYYEAKTAEELSNLFGTPHERAEVIRMKVNLVIAIRRALEKKNYTHLQASQKAGVGRTVITAVVNGDLQKISTERLIRIALGLGIKIELKIAS